MMVMGLMGQELMGQKFFDVLLKYKILQMKSNERMCVHIMFV